ncbi:ataxin-3-like protein [Striga asiatica]|uniref:ubiquitinyl hydrolase 1 n=1 Tax=Striga asiatica TaxID=4170 RepID=A0A5A7RF67_STRAF|nr:ataxin-3-like protein [Striga asiatica]
MGIILYHEVQESKLCALHCVNAVLQGPFFSEFDLAAMAAELDRAERQVMLAASGDFEPEFSHNVSPDGDFSIQVLEKALEVMDLQVIPLDSPVAQPAKIEPGAENAYICNLLNHWFCIKKVEGEWYNFNSLYPAPEHLSRFYLAAYLDSLKGSGWSIFLVRGNFPLERPEVGPNGPIRGRWLSPEEAKGILVRRARTRWDKPRRKRRAPILVSDDDEDDDDECLKEAIAASLKESSSCSSSSSGARLDENGLEGNGGKGCEASENRANGGGSENDGNGVESDRKRARVEG